MLNFDHAIVAVRDLEAAIANYRALGFTVYYGGKHTHKSTHNGLIALADGSYLELLAPVEPDDLDGSVEMLAHGEGFGGYALLTKDLDGDVARLRADGIDCSEPADGNRERHDGVAVKWRAANVGATRNPFLITDVTPHNLRVPTEAEMVQHKNGARAIAELTVVVPDLKAAIFKYSTMLDVAPVTERLENRTQTYFALGNCTLIAVQPHDATSKLGAQLARSGESVAQIKLHGGRNGRRGVLDVQLAHGAEIELV